MAASEGLFLNANRRPLALHAEALIFGPKLLRLMLSEQRREQEIFPHICPVVDRANGRPHRL
ncbi:hypothetical protein PLANPX_3296 [Lacipirellula parvula]|uniref:Uncharacterized protein n=1 Tax=Lacipirellula parvula TaxID=2650471 RepID=A0A5K7XAF3_9BACT|nr:hypothetical protein PLANPX_3296 [Lacipirellula parvula]